jgi:hypothetical protein
VQRNPTSFTHGHSRPPPTTISAIAESTYATSTRRGCDLCVMDCVERRFGSSPRPASRMRHGCFQARVGLRTRSRFHRVAKSRWSVRSVVAKVRAPTNRQTASLAVPGAGACRLSFIGSGLRRQADRRARLLAASVFTVRPGAAADGQHPINVRFATAAARLGHSCAGAGPGQVYCGRAAP